MLPRPCAPAVPFLAFLAATVFSAAVAGVVPSTASASCPRLPGHGSVAVLCDPGRRVQGRLAARSYRSTRSGGRALLEGPRALPVGRRVTLSRGYVSRRARLVLSYRVADTTVYVRFARFGARHRLLSGVVLSRRIGGRSLRARLRIGHRRFAPRAQFSVPADAAEPAPEAPAPSPALDGPPPPQAIGCRDGSTAWATPDGALDRQWRTDIPGWSAGDGALSAPLPDGRVVWLFGDSVLGGGGAGSPVRNSMVIQQGSTLSVAGPGLAAALESGYRDQWYWPQAALAEGGELRAFFGRYRRSGDGPWGFEYVDSQLAEISLPDLTVRQVSPVYPGGPVAWGVAILKDADWTYVYGVEDRGLEKYLHVARVPHDGLLGPWEFWTGILGWSLNPATSARIQGGVSNLVTAFGTGDGYLLITQEQLGRRIYALWSPTPTGPWSNPQTIYTTPEGTGFFTYNAVAHPELSGDGRLLLSYSVSVVDAQAPASAPRFVRVPVACLKGR